jgi:DNA topoisomerase-2
MDLEPWYRGFKGSFEWNNESRDGYNVSGKINRVDHNTIEITELPLRKWTRDYKTFLENMVDKKKNDANII